MWYEWNTQADFDTWHNALCLQLGYPLTGVNQATGLPDEEAAKTSSYTSSKLVGDKIIAMVEIEYADGLTPTDLRPASFDDES
jgi:myosin-crossreactive antigen